MGSFKLTTTELTSPTEKDWNYNQIKNCDSDGHCKNEGLRRWEKCRNSYDYELFGDDDCDKLDDLSDFHVKFCHCM